MRLAVSRNEDAVLLMTTIATAATNATATTEDISRKLNGAKNMSRTVEVSC